VALRFASVNLVTVWPGATDIS